MPRTALFMGPMARKKHVSRLNVINSYRVISEDAEHSYLPKLKGAPSFISTMNDYNIMGQPSDKMRPISEYRHNRPNPGQVNFLRQDVKLMNEPVCDVHTSSTKEEQYLWWNHIPSSENPSVPSHTLDTTARMDFQYRGSSQKGNSRHSSNPNTKPALGSVPVNMMRKADGQQRFWKEGISYEHQYNSRLEPQYPVRAKRHGAFVWDEMAPNEVDKILIQNDYKFDSKPPAVEDARVNVTCESTKTEPASTTEPAAAPVTQTSIPAVPTLPPIKAL